MNYFNAYLSEIDAASAPPGPLRKRAVDLFGLWRERIRQRRDLARLEPRLLADIGLESGQALEEARKPFWEA